MMHHDDEKSCDDSCKWRNRQFPCILENAMEMGWSQQLQVHASLGRVHTKGLNQMT